MSAEFNYTLKPVRTQNTRVNRGEDERARKEIFDRIEEANMLKELRLTVDDKFDELWGAA